MEEGEVELAQDEVEKERDKNLRSDLQLTTSLLRRRVR